MDLGAALKQVEAIRDYQISKLNLKATLEQLALINMDISELIKNIDLAREGKIDTPFREIIDAISEDLDELEYLMAKKKQFETEIEKFENDVEEQTEE